MSSYVENRKKKKEKKILIFEALYILHNHLAFLLLLGNIFSFLSRLSIAQTQILKFNSTIEHVRAERNDHFMDFNSQPAGATLEQAPRDAPLKCMIC
jgi:hypothetical protein